MKDQSCGALCTRDDCQGKCAWVPDHNIDDGLHLCWKHVKEREEQTDQLAPTRESLLARLGDYSINLSEATTDEITILKQLEQEGIVEQTKPFAQGWTYFILSRKPTAKEMDAQDAIDLHSHLKQNEKL